MPTTNNRKQSLLIITIIMLLVLSCNLWNSFTPDPTSIINSVEGAWVPSVFSFDFLEESGYEFSEMMITFNKDNIINVINLPADWIFQDNYS
ncbi:MAG TPA: hypothetical protein VK851_01055, partial [Anaerolineales bacterium]|nr:hypothetical protein [Anaerolineales bacterium]